MKVVMLSLFCCCCCFQRFRHMPGPLLRTDRNISSNRAFTTCFSASHKARFSSIHGIKILKARLSNCLKRSTGLPVWLNLCKNYVAIRDFPRALLRGQRDELLQVCLRGIRNCMNLRICTWTRDGSLSEDILEALQQLPLLSELEMNGHNQGQYRAIELIKFNHLQKISLIMPSSPVVTIMPRWMQITGSTLRHLSLICKSSPLINDSLLAEIAPNLVNLEQLYIVGCPKATHDGVRVIVEASQKGLVSLGMEGISPTFDMEHFAKECHAKQTLTRLRSITLTVPITSQSTTAWMRHVELLLSSSSLQHFHISTVGGEVSQEFDTKFCERIVRVHGNTLRRVSVHRLRMSIEAIDLICRLCPHLQQLFIVLNHDNLELLKPCLLHTRELRVLHINRPLSSNETVPMVSAEKALTVVNACASELYQIGFNTRVWQVEREIGTNSDGTLRIERKLGPYELPQIPEQFLVVRT
ncbi:hypothetical protein ABKN59_004757 [Abortiporus biennis]